MSSKQKSRKNSVSSSNAPAKQQQQPQKKAPTKAATTQQPKQAEKAEEKLQALVLADSFTNEFRPITLEKPRSLLPLVNVPILEYVLELLAASGVQEVFIFCCHGAKQIEQYVQKSQWGNGNNPSIVVQTVTSESALSFGDALRFVQSLDVIRSDFVLIAGDVISNINLRSIIDAFKAERKQPNSNLLVTTLLKKHRQSKIHYLQDKDHVWVAISPSTNQLLYFENDKNVNTLAIDLTEFQQHPDIQIRSDLKDCNIYICSPEVLEIFNENFDFQDFQQDFLKNHVLHGELTNYKVIPHIITEYAARVSSLRNYDDVSKDLVKRWVYPLTVDSNFSAQTNFKYLRPSNYMEDNISLARTCKIEEDVVIARGTQIGEGTIVTRSILGKNVKIGKDCKIIDSFVWDNAVIDDGAFIYKSLVCNGAMIGKKSALSKGSIVSYNVVVGDGFTVKEHVRLTLKQVDTEDDDDEESENATQSQESKLTVEAEVGKGGAGHAYTKLNLSNKFNLLGVQDYELSAMESVEMHEVPPITWQQTQTANNLVFDHQKETEMFAPEVQDTIKRAIKENHSIDNTKLEVNGLKFAYDASFMDCAKALISGIITHIDDGKRSSVEMLKLFKIILIGEKNKSTAWKTLLEFYIRDPKSEVEALEYILEFCKTEGKKFGPLIQFLVQLLYEAEIFSETSILKWASDTKQSTDSQDLKLVAQCEKFVQWLETAEEEDEDDDDDE